jgi:hypothetical protein
MKTRILAIALCLVTVTAFGQSNPKMKELKVFVGSWHCTGVAFASPWGPEHPTKATVHGSWILGGAWLEIHYAEMKTAKNPHPFDVMSFWSYDEQPKAFVAGTIDNMGGYAAAQSPGWDSDRLTFTGPTHGGGVTMNGRDIFTKVSDNEIHHESEIDDQGTWKKTDQETCKR